MIDISNVIKTVLIPNDQYIISMGIK